MHVIEGQHVAVGDPLFDIDPTPYRTALALAQGHLAAAKVEFANLRASYVSNEDQIKMGQEAVDLRQTDYDRKLALLQTRAGTQADVDTSNAALVQAKQILEFVRAAAGHDQGQARRRARRFDRDLPRLHPGQGPGGGR